MRQLHIAGIKPQSQRWKIQHANHCATKFWFMYLFPFQQIGNLVAANMRDHGTKFIERSVPTAIEKQQDGKLKVEWRNLESDETHEDSFDTVLFAIGRKSPSLRL